MEHDIDFKYKKLVKHLEIEFGPGLDTHTILFIIGVQELGMGYKEYKKNEKTDLMHIGMCTILLPYGFYKFIGRDDDYWPHFETVKKIPFLNKKGQEHLVKEALINYFVENGYVPSEVIESDKII